MSPRVSDPFGAAADPRMLSLPDALNPAEAEQQIGLGCPGLTEPDGKFILRSIRVTRYKPGRRCLIEYEGDVVRRGAAPAAVCLVGKVRAKGADRAACALLEALGRAGFGPDSPDGVSVPAAVGVVPGLGMWLQHRVPGLPATDLLAGEGGPSLARRIAGAIHKVHRAGLPAPRRHTIADELATLQARLADVAADRPGWAGRLDRLLAACRRVAADTPDPQPVGSHRDFYPDQVLVDGSRLYLLDFDLFAEADAGLDVGNFVGHLTEQALRTLGSPEALAECEAAMEERFVELSGEACRPAVRAYAALTLSRHVYLSTRFPERRPFTAALLELCEQRLSESARRTCVGGRA
jgi:hypothetical protein